MGSQNLGLQTGLFFGGGGDAYYCRTQVNHLNGPEYRHLVTAREDGKLPPRGGGAPSAIAGTV